MSNVLVIKSHPLNGEGSRTVTILDTFLDAYTKENPTDEVTVLDLYNSFIPEIDEEMLQGWTNAASGLELTEAQQKKVSRFKELTEQFLATDKIVIANPLWNLNVPTRLKAWVDTIMVSGTTFKYTATGPVGLTEGKKVLHIQSSGGIYNGEDFASTFVKTALAFVGVSDHAGIYIEGIDHDPSKSEEIMQALAQQATDIAQSF